MRKIIISLLFVCAPILLALPNIAGATKGSSVGTVVPGIIDADTLWSAEGSPYLVSGDTHLTAGHTLTIGPGVVVKINPNGTLVEYSLIIDDGASLRLEGTRDSRITMDDVDRILISGKNASIYVRYTDMTPNSMLSFLDSNGDIASSTFTSTIAPSILMSGGRVNVNSSRFTGFGGIFAIDLATSPVSLSVHNSIVTGSSYGIRSETTPYVSAENNWWGRSDGPTVSSPGGIIGNVSYAPWLTSEPKLDDAPIPGCCSSILFIPGLEASRLFRPESILGIPTTNKLWEPNRNADVEKLFLDTNGSSSDASIYSGDPIDKALGLKSIYGKFMALLDDLAAKGTVNEWKSFGYDWRKPITEVVAGNEKRATTTESLVRTVEDLASRSKTGKVTLIAHSNGGLVAKYLVKTLSDKGRAGIIDSVISVAVPYLGTPQAIASILHGDGEDILDGWILSKANARKLGENMASAYSLLPSAEYFKRMIGPAIAFASTTVPGINDGSYPQAIDSWEGQSSFIADTANVRKVPAEADVASPIKGNAILMAAANVLHAIIDPFSLPATIAKYAILGWGNDTARKVIYSKPAICYSDPSDKSCTDPRVGVLKSNMGDNTVMAQSAAYNAGTTTSIDLVTDSKAEGKEFRHENILESSTTETVLGKIITKDYSSFCDEISKLPGAACGEPDYSKEATNLVFSTHSPVELHVYDSLGRHTGLIPMPEQLKGQVDDDLYTFTEEKIPGSSLDLLGNDGDPGTYINVPDDGEAYTVVIKGTGVGTFDYVVERQNPRLTGGSYSATAYVIGNADYDKVPVTPLTIATTTFRIAPISNEATISPGFASSTEPLVVDVDGDGTVDFIATSTASYSGEFDSTRYIESMKQTVITLIGSSTPQAKNLLRRLDRLEDLVKQGKDAKSHDFTDRLSKRLGHSDIKGMTDGDKQKILDMIGLFISQYE